MQPKILQIGHQLLQLVQIFETLLVPSIEDITWVGKKARLAEFRQRPSTGEIFELVDFLSHLCAA